MIISEKKNTKETQYKVSNRDGFDSEPVFNEKDIKDKIKPYESKIYTDFHDNAMPKKECPQCIRLSVLLLIDCIFEMGRSYYSQVLLEKCNYLALYYS